MTIGYPLCDCDMQKLIDLAWSVIEACEAMPEHHRDRFRLNLINQADIVWGVWPDKDSVGLFHFLCIKGDGQAGRLKTAAIPLNGLKAAEDLREYLATNFAPAGLM